jgi:hypothetical protein
MRRSSISREGFAVDWRDVLDAAVAGWVVGRQPACGGLIPERVGNADMLNSVMPLPDFRR